MIDEVLGKVSAYAYAVEKGYTGTETQFAYDLAHAADYASTAGTAAENASESEENAKDSEEAAALSEQNAQTYANNAHSDAAAALEAKTQAITAKNDAVSAKGSAENFASLAEDAKGSATQSAQNASQSAESASDDAEAASNSASSASVSSLKSEGFAVGKQNGTPVESGSPYYENNAKYYCEEAAEQLTLVTNEGTRQIGLVTDEGTAQKAAVQEKGEQTLASIPEDYTTLRNDVSSLKSDMVATNDILDETIGTSLETIFNSFAEDGGIAANMANAPFVITRKSIIGVTLLGIRLNIASTGTLTIGTAPIIKSGDIYDETVLTPVEVINVTKTGVQTILFSTPIKLEYGRLFIGLPTDTCSFYYGGSGTDNGFVYHANGANTYTSSTTSLNVDILGFISASTVSSNKNSLDYIKETLFEDVTFIDSYNVNNLTETTSTNSPFVISKSLESEIVVNAIKLDVTVAGTFTIGKIKKEKLNEDYNSNNLLVGETLHITNTGIQTIALNKPLTVGTDEYIFVVVYNNTCRFKYGSYGVDKGFYYVNNANRWVLSSNSIGISFIGMQPKSDNSVYKGKSISILGDSISTFSGYIPTENATYYPAGTVQNVNDTWWKKLIDALGLVLNINNSWSGSRVTTTGGNNSAGCMARCEALGDNPDVIIVWMGINDFNNEVAVGTYDGTTAIPSSTTTFREAYAIMLNKILTKYQTAEVWVCTLPQCERNSETGFPEINNNGVALFEFNKAILELANAFGVKVLDHNKCGLTYQNMPTFNPDNLHPNKFGHSLIANNDIWQMDNSVKTRYGVN